MVHRRVRSVWRDARDADGTHKETPPPVTLRYREVAEIGS
jgi:hypothetical protein